MSASSQARNHADPALHDSHVTAWRERGHEQARRFLQRLDPEADIFTFQTFDDTPAKRRELARIVHGDFERVAGSLDAQQQQQAGVFVTVNATDGKGRQAHNILRVRAVFVDLDGAPLGPVLEAGLDPHIVCESSPGRFHAYWLCDDCPLDQFERAQKALARRFSGDPSVHDLPRVMRLPGFRHFKREARTSHLVDEFDSKAPPYGLAEIIEALRLDLNAPEEKRQARLNGGGIIAPGNRHSHLFASGRSMARKGLSREAVRAALAVENQMRCDPPLPEGEIDHLAVRAFTAKDAQGWQESAPRAAGYAASGDFAGTEWPEPLPLVVKVQPEPYPLDALPDTIREAVIEVQGFTKAPIPLVASSALGALSLAIQANADVKRAEKLSGPTSLFLLTIADSGERKSTCDGIFTKAIRDHEAQQAEAAKPKLKDHRAAMHSWEAKRGGIKDKIRQLAKRGNPTSVQEAELRDLGDAPEPPRVPKLIYGDATPEALKWNLAKLWPSGGVISAEGGIVFGSHGMNRESIMRNLATLNELWDGKPISTERRTSESFTVRGARLTIAIQVQEATLRGFFDRSSGLARGTGFLARFLAAWPESTQGFRAFTEPPENWPALAVFNGRMAAILDQPVPIDDDGALSPPMLSLTTEAKAAWVKFHDEIEGMLRTGGELYDVRDVASKSADNAARLAALFQIFEHAAAGVVGLEAFSGASTIVAWHLNESRRFLGELALPVELANAARLDAWLIEYCKRERTHIVPRREVQRCGPNGLREKVALTEALRELAEAGRVRVVHEGRRKEIRVNSVLVIEGGAA